MTGPTILTTAALPARRCWLCGDPAVAGTGVAVARWWCLQHFHVGLANTSADLAILRAQLHQDEQLAENGRWGERRHAWTDPTPEQAEQLDAALSDDHQEAATA